ncbi:carboxyltransferase domain-containing protein [Gordonia jinghuaiqii]|uniref:Carboxyltransferase domain-containing protein n=1 Tax=Gordonia jinghuaiqii TaxID=2758710 RepID=A0A7D7QH80_9ACTN|nr:carboxyltransferase domain-containing protein [Gordonia jinghuaiqii]MCR5977865.1 carboxyltransferase domain-containing protein [Gordonia jinghuaiqii]QMT02522.1 carboxyltransferase domain-containing protein [Gordonia jinghuaiqii]
MKPEYFVLPGGARLSFGGDEFVFVELSESMDLEVALQVQSIAASIVAMDVDGVVDVVPAHVSYMIRVRPEDLDPRDVVPLLIGLHQRIVESDRQKAPTIPTAIVEIPVFYDDPWTREVTAKFRDRHPSPEETDLAYTARVNGFDKVDDLIAAHSAYPFIVTFNNFIPGNAECVQLVPQDMQIDVPKYLRPRTQTPARSLGHGGNQATIYPSEAPGGFQLLGRAAVPVVDLTMTRPGFTESPVLLPAPTIVKYRPVDQSGYDEVESAVEAGTYEMNRAAIEFDLQAFTADPLGYTRSLVGELR